MSQWNPSRRNVILAFLIAALAVGLGELIFAVPRVLEVWHPYDYGRYVAMGNALRQDPASYGSQAINTWYPLPAQLWLFVPLSLLPDWFRLVWVLAPLAFVVVLLRARALLLLLFPPLWFVVGHGMLDGWLLIPIAWMVENRPILAGLGIVLTMVKPQIAIFTGAYLILRWIVERDWRNLGTFIVALFIFCLPAFVLDPGWPLKMLAALPERTGEGGTEVQLLVSSLWAWWRLDGFARLVFVALGLVAGVLFLRGLHPERNRASSFQLLNLLLVPVLYAGSLITMLPILRRPRHVFFVVLTALGAFVLDNALNGFGGGYVFVSLTAFYFLSNERKEWQANGVVSDTDSRAQASLPKYFDNLP